MAIDKRGKDVYRFRVQFQKVSYSTTFYGTEKQAKLAHEQFKLDIKQGKYIANENMTLEELWDLYFESRKLTPQTEIQHRYKWNKFNEILNTRVVDLTKLKLQTLYNKLKSGKSEQDGDFATLKAVLNFAVEMEIIDKNPITFKLRRSKPKVFEQILTTKQLDELIKKISEMENRQIAVMLLTEIFTGNRIGEVRSLQKKCVDPKKHEMKISQQYKIIDAKTKKQGLGSTKTGISKKSYIPTPVRKDIYGLMEGLQDNDFIFANPETRKPYTVATINRYLADLCTDINVPKLTSHKLRAIYTTMQIYAGVNIVTISKNLGHSSTSMTERYIKSFQDADEKSRDLFEDYLKNFSKKS